MQTIISSVSVTDWRQALLLNREKTLTKIYARAYPMVLHYVKQRSGTPEDAQDLLQEAIIVFYEKVMHEQLILSASVTTYLMSICKNQWRRELERRRREELTVANQMPATPLSSETERTTLELMHYVAQLGTKCRDILLAFYYYSQPMPVIAAQHHYRNVRSATVQKFKCLERLRKSLASFTAQQFR